MITAPQLYCITNEELSGISHEEQVLAMLDAGARLIQVREKDPTRPGFGKMVEYLAQRARAAGGRLILNDHVELAHEAGVSGVHVGQGDMSPTAARKIMGDRAVIGISTHTREQFEDALQAPVDYIALGPVFGTTTKGNPDPPPGMDVVEDAARAMEKDGRPLVLIGGIDRNNLRTIKEIAPKAIIAVMGALLRGKPLDKSVREWIDLVGYS